LATGQATNSFQQMLLFRSYWNQSLSVQTKQSSCCRAACPTLATSLIFTALLLTQSTPSHLRLLVRQTDAELCSKQWCILVLLRVCPLLFLYQARPTLRLFDSSSISIEYWIRLFEITWGFSLPRFSILRKPHGGECDVDWRSKVDYSSD
jgi:hypothetical protein